MNLRGIDPITKRKIWVHLLEFFFVGLIMGVGEDLLAIHFATEAKITPHIFKVAFLVALPFAFISEILIDLKVFRRIWKKNQTNLSPK